MKTEHWIILGFGAVVVGIAAFLEARAGPYKKGPEITVETIMTGTKLPKIWLFYDNSEINSREWADFGSRTSHVINIPLLNLLYQTIVMTNGDKYKVEVIGGLTGVAELLGEDTLPSQVKKGSLGVAEMDWIRTAILAKFGGLWLSPAVLCMKGFGDLPSNKIVAFGEEDESMYGSAGASPGFRALWCPNAGNQVMVDWERRIRDRLESQLGGLQIRGDAKSDWAEIDKEVVEVRRKAEFGRKADGKKLELEDIFSNASPVTVPSNAIYMAIPYRELLDRRIFGWVLKISEEDLLESNTFISNILNKLL